MPNSLRTTVITMCGRYALGIVSSNYRPCVFGSTAELAKRASFVRHQLEQHNMPVDDAPEDDDVRQTYNFAPGNHGLVYRADVPDRGAGRRQDESTETSEDNLDQGVENDHAGLESSKEARYKLQAMTWGRLHIEITNSGSEQFS